MEYLDFEEPIKELEDQLLKCQEIGNDSEVDVTEACKKIEDRLTELKKEIYSNLTPWQLGSSLPRLDTRCDLYKLQAAHAATSGALLT